MEILVCGMAIYTFALPEFILLDGAFLVSAPVNRCNQDSASQTHLGSQSPRLSQQPLMDSMH